MKRELEEHAWRVGRIAIAAAQMEAEVAVLVHVATTGAWDNSDDWLSLATSTHKLRRKFKKVLTDYPGLLDAEVYLGRFDDLLDRRNKVVHASVRYSFFEVVDGVFKVRESPFEAQVVHARTGHPEQLPSEETITALETELQEMASTIRTVSGRYASEFERRAKAAPDV
jgi:hypothetical protein